MFWIISLWANKQYLGCQRFYFSFVISDEAKPKSMVACENSRFSSLLPTGDVLRGGTSVTQWQKFHTDGVNQCLHNKFGSHGVPNANVFNFTFLLVDFGKVWCSSVNKLQLQQNSNTSSTEKYIPQKIDCFVKGSSRLHLTFVAFCLSFVDNS